LAAGLRRTCWGSFSAPLDPLAAIKGFILLSGGRGTGRKRGKREEREMDRKEREGGLLPVHNS